MKLAHKLLIAFSIFLVLMVKAATSHAQTTHEYQGKVYSIHVGEKGGKYILLETGEKHYIAQDLYVDENATTFKYQGTVYPIKTGPKGGIYILHNGNKVYLKKKKPKS